MALRVVGYVTAAAFRRTPTTQAGRYARNAALRVVDRMRASPGMSATTAARREGTTLRSAERYAGQALRRDGGRFKATYRDSLPRSIVIAGERLDFSSSQQYYRARHFNRDLDRLTNADGAEFDRKLAAMVKEYGGKSVKLADGTRWKFPASPDQLRALVEAGGAEAPY